MTDDTMIQSLHQARTMTCCWYGWAWIGLIGGFIAGIQFGIAIGLWLA